jgi:hypothetical protein
MMSKCVGGDLLVNTAATSATVNDTRDTGFRTASRSFDVRTERAGRKDHLGASFGRYLE